MNRSDGSR